MGRLAIRRFTAASTAVAHIIARFHKMRWEKNQSEFSEIITDHIPTNKNQLKLNCQEQYTRHPM